jgi:TRAP-type C4-dicarboxylate transport system permease small subunit
MLERINLIVLRIAQFGLFISFALLLGSVMIQVVGRISGSSPVWTEELTRYALLFTISFGSGLAFRTGDLVNVDIVMEAVPSPIAKLMRLFAAAATAAMSIYLLPHAWKYVSIGKMQTSPALGVRMDFIHLTIWLTLLGLGIFATLRVLDILILKSSGKPTNNEIED